MTSTGWDHFWKEQKESFNSIMVINTYFFGEQMERVFQIRPDHQIFDYGCGPGLLIDYLSVKEINPDGADINPSYLEQCKINHPKCDFIQITPHPDENSKILNQKLKDQKFDFIVLLSISQYFKDINELRSVVEMLTHYIKIDGKIIIADVIDPNTSPIRDTLSLLVECLKKHKIISFIQFISYLIFSDYRKISKASPLLVISRAAINRVADDFQLTCEQVNGLTIHSSRTNYVLTKIT